MILDKLFAPSAATLKAPDEALTGALFAAPSYSGVAVTPDTALREATVYACCNVLASTLAALPMHLHRHVDDKNTEIATQHPLNMLLHRLPNEEMTAMDFRVKVMFDLLLRGNSYNEIERNRAGQIVGIYPLNPDCIEVDRSKTTKKLVFIEHGENGGSRTIQNHRIWRIIGNSTNGIVGLSPIAMERETIGTQIAMQEFGARMFSNGAMPGGVLEHPAELSETAKQNILSGWNRSHQGNKKAHNIAVLEEGMKWQQVSMKADEAQFLESRKYGRTEIAAIFGVPQHMVGEMGAATFSNIEHQAIEFVVHSLRPWIERIEQSIFRDLLKTREDRLEYFAKINVDGLLRGDSKSRSEFYRNLFNMGAISINDLRRYEDMNTIEDGEEHYLQVNMATVSQINEGTNNENMVPDNSEG